MSDVPSKPVGVPLVATSPPRWLVRDGLSVHVVNDLNPDLPIQFKNAGDRHLPPCTSFQFSLMPATTEIRFIRLSPAVRRHRILSGRSIGANE
jgi:hypothetical protein